MTRFIFFTTLLLLVVPTIWCQMTFAERKALEDFKVTVPSLAVYWSANDTGPCGGEWQGITCTGGRVTTIDFRGMQMTGSLPDSLGDITALQKLYTSGNYFNGTIPASIGDLSQLLDLETTSNSFSGGIPETIGKLTKLTRLWLVFSNLTGTIPSSIGNLTSLKTLALDQNKLYGTIPETIGSMSSLVYLSCANNQLTGSIPNTITMIQTLQLIAVNQNQLNGTIPDTIENLTVLSNLQIMDNQFSGTFPSAVGRLPKLSTLGIQNNKFVGCLSLEHNPAGNFIGNKFCCYDTRYDPIDYFTYPCEASTTLSIGSGSVKSPTSTYYTSLSVGDNGVIDMTNQTELITVECLTINGTIRVNMSSIDISTQLTDIDLIKFTCSSTNISLIVMDIITNTECQSSYQIREKVVGRIRTVNVDIDIQCPNNPSSNQPMISNAPNESSSPSGATPNPTHSPQDSVTSEASSIPAVSVIAISAALVSFMT